MQPAFEWITSETGAEWPDCFKDAGELSLQTGKFHCQKSPGFGGQLSRMDCWALG